MDSLTKSHGTDLILERLPACAWTIAVASKRASGKSVLVAELIQKLLKKKVVDIAFIFSNSADYNGEYPFLPKKLVQKFNEKTLSAIWDRQARACKHNKDTAQSVLVVLDDCLADKDAVRSETLKRVFALGRHVKISCILISQVANWLLTPLIRQNSDLIIWSKLNKHQLMTLYESITNVDRNDFIGWAEREGGREYQFLLFDNICTDTDPAKMLYIVKADPPKNATRGALANQPKKSTPEKPGEKNSR